MDTKRIKKPLKKFVETLSHDIDIDEVIVFGSYLEGNATSDSDIDVVVVSSDFKKMNEDKRLLKLHRAARFSEPAIDPWGFTKEELKKAQEFSTLDYISKNGYRFTSL